MFRRSRRLRQGRHGRTIRFIHNNLDLLGVIATVILSYVAHFVERENNSDDISWQELLSIGLLPTASILGILAAAVDVFDEIPEQFGGNFVIPNNDVVDDPDQEHLDYAEITRTNAIHTSRTAVTAESVLLATLIAIVYYTRRADFESRSNIVGEPMQITVKNPINEHHVLFITESIFAVVEAFIYRNYSEILLNLQESSFSRFNYLRVTTTHITPAQDDTSNTSEGSPTLENDEPTSEQGSNELTGEHKDDPGAVRAFSGHNLAERAPQEFFQAPETPHHSRQGSDLSVQEADSGSIESLETEQSPLLEQDIDNGDQREDNSPQTRN